MMTRLLPLPSIRHFYWLSLLFFLIIGLNAGYAQRVEVDTRLVVTDLDTPWEIIWGPDDWIWVAERVGHVSRVHPETGERHLLLTVPAFHHQESGLYGIAHHPNFADSPYVFVNYSYQIQDPDGWYYNQRVVRYRYDSQQDTLVEEMILVDSIPSGYFHNGGRLLMLPDRTLLLTYGDQGVPSLVAQHQDSLQGKMLRMDLNGNAPPDNPFATYEYPLSLMYTIGHRNPQGLVRLPDGRIYSTEHGPLHSDELNLIQKGGNYGWPHVQGMCDNYPNTWENQYCADSNVIEPTLAFYNGWDMTVAPAGLVYYDGPFEPWKGTLLIATLKNALMQVRLHPTSGEVVEIHRYFATAFDHREYGRFRDLCISPDGRIFICTSNRDGRAPAGFPVDGDDRILELFPKVAQGHYINAQPIGTWKGCAGGHFDVEIEIGGEFGAGNEFKLELSDSEGKFDGGQRVVDILNNPPDQQYFKGSIPADVTPGGKYRTRLVSTNPPLASNASIETIEILAAPPKPTITRDGNDLVASGAERYQWFRGDTTPIEGANGPRLTLQEHGEYLVAVYNIEGCMTLSAPYEYTDTSVPTVPTKDALSIMVRKEDVLVGLSGSGMSTISTSDVKIDLSDIAGRTVYSGTHDLGNQSAIVPLTRLPSGMYIMRVFIGNEVLTGIVPVIR